MFIKFNTKRMLKIYGISVLSISLICIVLRLVSTLLFFDKNIGYYQSDKIIPIISNILPAISVIAAIVFCMIPRIRISPISPADTKYTKIGSVTVTAGFAIFAVKYISSLIEYNNFYGSIPFSYLFCLACTIAACVFFTLKAVRRVNADISYVLMWCVLQLAECYFDNFVQMNSPIKLVFQFACLGAILLTVNEMRISLDSKRKGFHLFSATVASIFLPLSAVPSIICYLTGNMPSSYMLFFADCVMLLFSVFAVTRLIQMCFGKESDLPSETCDEAKLIPDLQEQALEENSFKDTTEEES